MYISIPELLRIKPGVLPNLGKYLRRDDWNDITLYYGEGIEKLYGTAVKETLNKHQVHVLHQQEILSNAVENVFNDLAFIPNKTEILVAIGGGKVIDYCKYLGFLKQIPVIAVPTALSNDGMASPTASLTQNGKRKSFKARSPEGVLIDTDVILQSPARYTFSGIGDMISKITAIRDWKLAFHNNHEPVNDFSVLVAEHSVENVLGSPSYEITNPEFIKRLAGSLVMSGVAMEICGSSRPASGAEHLISHAYDEVAQQPSLHGLQVGVAAYATSWLQENYRREVLANFLLISGFASFVEKNPLSKTDFIKAIELAPKLRNNYYTILSHPDSLENLKKFIEEDQLLQRWLN